MALNVPRLGSNAKLSKDAVVELPITLYGTANVKKSCKISAYTYINSNTTIYPNTSIGRYCSIAKNCELGVVSHPIDWLSSSPFQYNMKLHFPTHAENCKNIPFHRPLKTFIGHDVWIGSGVTIIRGTKIGHGSIIAAGAVVTKDIPPYAIVGGIPAKIIKYRFDEKTIEILLSLNWWDLIPQEMADVRFDNIEHAIEDLTKILETKSIVQEQLSTMKKAEDTSTDTKTENTIQDLQKKINQTMKKSEASTSALNFEEIKLYISSALTYAEIPKEIIETILIQNKSMNTDYDLEEHLEQVLLKNKLQTMIEVILQDNSYKQTQTLSEPSYKKIQNILRDKQ